MSITMGYRIAIFWMAVMALATPAWSYEEIQVANGGTITGKVTLTGKEPTPLAFNLVTFPNPTFCGAVSTGTGWRLLKEFETGPDGGLKNTVVMLMDVRKGKPFKFSPPTIEARDCEFAPFVVPVKDNAEVVVVNMDPVYHDIQAYQTSELGARVLFNDPLPFNAYHRTYVKGKRNMGPKRHEHEPGIPIKETIHLTKGRRTFFMQCGFHAYMVAWGAAVDNPYYALTKEDGTFTISDVPPGEYELAAWHPGAGPMLKQHVTVSENRTVSANFQVRAILGRHSGQEVEANPRFGLAALGRPLDIKPEVEQQAQ